MALLEGHVAPYAERMTQPAPASALAEVTLAGQQVRLEPLSMVHIEGLLSAATEDRATYQWTTVPSNEGEMRAYVSTALELASHGAAVPFVTRIADGGRIVGSTRFANFENHPWPPSSPHFRPGGEPDAVEIGWTWLAPSAQRSAVNTEAKWLMLRHAFEAWHLRCVRLKTDSRNVRSRAAIERIGCKFDGILRAHSPGADGAMRDSAYYSLVESEWPAADAALRSRLARA